MNALFKFTTALLLLFLGNGLIGQTSFDRQIINLQKGEKIDSMYIVMDQFSEQYTAYEQWDSVLYVAHQRGNLSFRYKSIDVVLDQIEEGERIAAQYVNEENPFYLDFLEFVSDVNQDVGNYQRSGEILDKIISIGSRIQNDTTGIVESAKSEKAFLYLYLGKVEESNELARSVYDNIIARGDTSQIMTILQALSMSNQWLNNLDDAIRFNTENLNIIRKYNGEKHPNVGLILVQAAGMYTDKGQFKEALDNYNKAREIHLYNYRTSGSTRMLSTTIGNMGDFYTTMGEYRLAIDHMTYALDLVKAEYGENSWTCMWHYSVLSTACRLYGDYDKADEYIDAAFRLIESNEQSTPYDYYHFLSRKAEMLFTRNQYEEAESMAKEVYDFFDKNQNLGSMNDRLHILNLMSNIYADSEDWEKAKEWSELNIKYHKENTAPMSDLMLGVWVSELVLYSDLMDSVKVNEVVKEVLTTRNIGNQKYTLSNCVPENSLLEFSAVYAEFLIKLAEGNANYRQRYFEFLDEFERYYSIHLATIKTNSNLAANEQFLKRIYTPAIQIKSSSDPQEALLFIEKCKGFQIRQVLQNQLIDDENLPTLDYNLENSPGLNEDSISIELFMELSSSLDSVTTYKDSLLSNDPLKYQKYFGIKELTVEDIRGLLADDELLVGFFVHDTLLFTYYVEKEKLTITEHSYPEIEQLAKELLESNTLKSGNDLRSVLLPDALISDYKKIKILPDGILNSISFEQLDYMDKPLIYSKCISYGNSASILLFQEQLTKRKNAKNQFLGLTPGFTRDLKMQIDSLYSDTDSSYFYLLQQPFLLSLSESLSRSFSGESYMNADATEQKFKSKARDFSILHIGTHGVLNDNSPLFSKLIFAKDSLEDGYLHAYELYGNNLNADLAVLSACSSGKEKTYASEGIVSLSHAFTYAGCPAVLMTKWDVDEKSTSYILDAFYKNLKLGMTKSNALREAKLAFLNDSPAALHDPYYWAGLVLIGDDAPMFNPSIFSSNSFIALATLLIFICLYIVIKRKKS